jgi:hypothetical protein
MMTYEEFAASLGRPEPPEELPVPLQGLWLVANGDWGAAHNLVQDDPSDEAAWVHAHLHRIEGDIGNAGYWYNRSGRPPTNVPFEKERESIARALLEEGRRL